MLFTRKDVNNAVGLMIIFTPVILFIKFIIAVFKALGWLIEQIIKAMIWAIELLARKITDLA